MTKIQINGDDEGYHSRRSKSCGQSSREQYVRHIGALQTNYCVWKEQVVCDMWEIWDGPGIYEILNDE